MESVQVKGITKDFPDVKSILLEQAELKKKQVRIRRKLQSLYRKYSFLKGMLDVKSQDDNLVKNIIHYFKFLGLKIENADKKHFNKEDLHLYYENKLVLIEVTGSEKSNPKETKTHQISKHIPIRKKQFPKLKVSGLFIINHSNNLNFMDRENDKVFSVEQKKIAASHEYSLMTTIDLLSYFIDIQLERKTTKDLIDKITTF